MFHKKQILNFVVIVVILVASLACALPVRVVEPEPKPKLTVEEIEEILAPVGKLIGWVFLLCVFFFGLVNVIYAFKYFFGRNEDGVWYPNAQLELHRKTWFVKSKPPVLRVLLLIMIVMFGWIEMLINDM